LEEIYLLLKSLTFFYRQFLGPGQQICVHLMYLLTDRVEFFLKPEFGTVHGPMNGCEWMYETDEAHENKGDKQTLKRRDQALNTCRRGTHLG